MLHIEQALSQRREIARVAKDVFSGIVDAPALPEAQLSEWVKALEEMAKHAEQMSDPAERARVDPEIAHRTELAHSELVSSYTGWCAVSDTLKGTLEMLRRSTFGAMGTDIAIGAPALAERFRMALERIHAASSETIAWVDGAIEALESEIDRREADSVTDEEIASAIPHEEAMRRVGLR